MPSLADWRAQVDRELAGASFDTLVQVTAEGLAIQPLYTEGPVPASRGDGAPFGICARVHDAAEAAEELDGGADALWVESGDVPSQQLASARGAHVITEQRYETVERASAAVDSEAAAFELGTCWFAFDPIAIALRLDPKMLSARLLGTLVPPTQDLANAKTRMVCVSSLPYHAAGADAADELALSLAATTAYLHALVDGGVARATAASQIWFQLAIGRDTFGEICKLRALRVCAAKIYAALGVHAAPPPIHAVASPRTQAQHDPWVNMLRVTTELFAAILGGARYVTPAPFDDALGRASALGRRVARNTALVLRDESYLGRVADAAGGSYFFESRTDALAREAWQRFQQLEADGGIVPLVSSGKLADRLDAAWKRRASAIAKRKEPILGVSEFANVDERLPETAAALGTLPSQLPRHRDAEGFESLRTRAAALGKDVALIALGPPAEHRARAAYATALFATAGLRVRTLTAPAHADVAVICGSDDRYIAEAAATARALVAAGCWRVVLAGKPGAREAELRAAGVDTFIFVGCDALATLKDLVGGAA